MSPGMLHLCRGRSQRSLAFTPVQPFVLQPSLACQGARTGMVRPHSKINLSNNAAGLHRIGINPHDQSIGVMK